VIGFDLGEVRFNYRVGAAMFRGDTVLLQTVDDIDFWVVPGGRVEAGESAAAALARELHEELGVDVRVERLLWIVENFFSFDGRAYHEIGLYFLAPPPESLAHEDAFDGVAADVRLRFRWFPLADLDQVDLRPALLREQLRHPSAEIQHVVQRDARDVESRSA
jgi:8-oxo-dGTP pyrophosphatase MutT (NUDIX family)